MRRKNIRYFIIILFILCFFDLLPIIDENMKWICCIIFSLLLLILENIMWSEQKSIKFEKMYLFSLVILCTIYVILFPPSTINDEHFHITMAYHFSNVLLGTEENDRDRSLEDAFTYVREGDINIIVEKSYYWGPSDRIAGRPDIETYRNVSNGIKKEYKGEKQLIAGLPGYLKTVSLMEYLPAALGMTFARVLGLNTYLLLYMAKVFNALTYIFLCYIAVKRIPQFKVSVALVSMLPIALQEATAISYDCVTNGIAFCLFAELILIILSSEIKRKNIFFIIVYTIILAFCKSGAYIFLVGMGAGELFGNKIKLKTKIAGCVILIVSVGIIVLNSMQGTFRNAGLEDKYTISFILREPVEFFIMCVKTIVLNASYYIESAMGSYMGWDQNVVPAMVAFSFVMILLLSTKFYVNTNFVLTVQNKIVSITIIIIEIIVLMVALLTDTPRDNETIYGIQGRYFLPIIPIILAIFTRENNHNQNKISNYKIVKYFMFIHIIEIYYLVRLYFSR